MGIHLKLHAIQFEQLAQTHPFVILMHIQIYKLSKLISYLKKHIAKSWGQQKF